MPLHFHIRKPHKLLLAKLIEKWYNIKEHISPQMRNINNRGAILK